MRPDLITLAAGGNDIIGFRVHVPSLTESFHQVLADLTGTGATVVVFAGFDPLGRLPVSRVLAARAAAYNAAVVRSAHELGAARGSSTCGTWSSCTRTTCGRRT